MARDKAEQNVRSLADDLRYIASILEANASKFTVPDHILQKAHKCREAADRIEALERELAESQS